MRIQKEKSSPVKASIGYTIGNYCIKGLVFITVPIFARLLSTSDFGIYNTFLAYEGILYLFISLALHSSLKNAKYKFEGLIDVYTSSITILPQIIAIIFIVGFSFSRTFLAKLLNLDETSIVLLPIYSYCSGLLILYQNRIAIDYNYKEYLRLSSFNVLCSVGLSLWLIGSVFDNKRYMGRISGGMVSYVLMAIYILCRLYKKAKPRINQTYWGYGLKISLPIIPHGLAQILLLQFDRIMINSMIGSAEAGLYSFAYTVYTIIQITENSLSTVFSPWVFGKLKDEHDVESVQRIGTLFLLFLSGLVTGVMLLSPELISILGGVKYKESIACVLPVVLAGFFAMGYAIPYVLECYYEKTKYIAVNTSIAAAMNITLNAIFIPRYGYVAAAYTTLASYVTNFVLHVIIAKRLSGFHIVYPKYLGSALVIVILAFIVAELFTGQLAIRITFFLLFVSVGLLMMAKIYELNNIKALYYKFTNRIKNGSSKQD